jgi:hypothetical protein
MMLQDPEPLVVLSVNLPDKRLGAVLLRQLQVLRPDDVLGQTGLGAKDRVQNQSGRLFVVEGGIEFFEGGVGEEEVLVS